MIYLYHGGGASITEILGPALPLEDWTRIRELGRRLLAARGHAKAAALLNEYPFEHLNATNYFNDEFTILRLTASLEQYVALSEAQADRQATEHFRLIAEAITELGPYVRFVVMLLDSDEGPLPVPPPSPRITSEAVEAALADAELLLRSRGPASALDRVHTALHGYLRAALQRAGEEVTPTASVTELFRTLRQCVPSLTALGTGDEDTRRIVMSLASIVDAANRLRNHASGAHPTDTKLNTPEAMLVVNTVRSLLHYLDAVLGE